MGSSRRLSFLRSLRSRQEPGFAQGGTAQRRGRFGNSGPVCAASLMLTFGFSFAFPPPHTLHVR